MKKVLFIFFLINSLFLTAQQGAGGVPMGKNIIQKMNKTIPTVYFSQPNLTKLREEDRINDSLRIGPWRFGYNYHTTLNFHQQGIWLPKKDGGLTWLLKISAKQAQTINLTFSNTSIPKGNKLYIYNADASFVLGKFTQKHLYKGELGAELIPGNTVIIEYDVPAYNVANLGNIEISTVTYGYRNARAFQEYAKGFGSSLNCEMNVNCPDGAPYIKQRNSAVMLVVGSNGFCSGALINNTSYNGTPYVLTANHCADFNGNFASWIFRFKWQSSSCVNPSTAPPFESVSGAVLRARRMPSDFCLVEITGGLTNGTVPEICAPYFSGWNWGNTAPISTFCIHHPRGDITKISFDDDPPLITQGMGSSEANSTWKVVWDRNTMTESASSGSPLFNNVGQIIGQLWGGSSANCSPSNIAYDYYGRLHNSWNPVGSNSTNQLEHWLDPIQSGATSITGFDPYTITSDYNVAVVNVKGIKQNGCYQFYYPKVIIQNRGNQPLTSLIIDYTYNTEGTQSITWTGNLNTYDQTSVTLPPITNISGQNQIVITAKKPNGQTDTQMNNNLLTYHYNSSPSGKTYDFTFYMGCYPNENSWELQDESGQILNSGNGPATSSNANHFIRDTFCLAEGCYTLILRDSYGDGVQGTQSANCGYNGSMTLIAENSGDTIIALPSEAANFGNEIAFDFCVTAPEIPTTPSSKEKNDLLVYPNPNNGVFTVKTTLKGIKSVSIFTVSGKKVTHFSTKDQAFSITHQLWAAGVYFLNVSNNEHSIIRKIVIY